MIDTTVSYRLSPLHMCVMVFKGKSFLYTFKYFVIYSRICEKVCTIACIKGFPYLKAKLMTILLQTFSMLIFLISVTQHWKHSWIFKKRNFINVDRNSISNSFCIMLKKLFISNAWFWFFTNHVNIVQQQPFEISCAIRWWIFFETK